MKSINTIISVALLSALVGCATNTGNKVVDGVGSTTNYVGSTVGQTVSAVGSGVTGTAERLTGNVDVVQAKKEVNVTTEEALARLLKLDKRARALYGISYGYAIFDSRKSSFLISLGSGGGVAVVKASGDRTYMRMFTGGVNVGAGIQFFQNVFLFENKASFDRFVNSGWEAGTSANANFGRDSLDAQIRFVNGMALFQLADTGINLSADFTGTKYWKDKTLN